MKITVDRYISDSDATLSKISIDNTFECYGLEDEHRKDKVSGETRIPSGTYKVGLRTTGGFHARYTKKFPDFHQGMLHVLDVPNFKYILIHIGNTDEDTNGCLLIGKSKVETKGKKFVGNSTGAYKTFYPKVIEAAKNGNLSITYIDNDLSEKPDPTVNEFNEDAKPESTFREYKVQPGESLSVIAKKLNTTIEALKATNKSKLKKWGKVEGFNANEIIKVP